MTLKWHSYVVASVTYEMWNACMCWVKLKYFQNIPIIHCSHKIFLMLYFDTKFLVAFSKWRELFINYILWKYSTFPNYDIWCFVRRKTWIHISGPQAMGIQWRMIILRNGSNFGPSILSQNFLILNCFGSFL